jgi:hypothetical protein
MKFRKGDEVELIYDDGAQYFLTKGKSYTVIKDEEEGIFKSQPFVTVLNDEGKPYVCHAARFKRPRRAS